jgi:hypothetical protein
MLANNPIDYADKNTPQRKRSIWPFLIVGLLCTHAGAMIYVVTLTQRNKPEVIDNYYEKAVNWDRDHGRTAK